MKMSNENDAITVRWPTFSSSMQANFRHLRSDNKLIDIIIAVENKQIPAHRLLLASCSEFFYNLFESLVTSSANPTIRKCNFRWESERIEYVSICCQPFSISIAVALAEVQYDEVMHIIELMYGGQVDMPKKNWSKFLAAATLLKINGFEKLRDINPYAIETGFEIRNCYVKLTDMSEVMHARDPSKATSIAAPGTSKTPPNAGSVTANTPPRSVQSTPNQRASSPDIDSADLELSDLADVDSRKRSSTGVAEVHSKKSRLRKLSSTDSSDSDRPIVVKTSGKLTQKKSN